jgi:hypothetical protein
LADFLFGVTALHGTCGLDINASKERKQKKNEGGSARAWGITRHWGPLTDVLPL